MELAGGAGLLAALVVVFLAGFLGILWHWHKAEELRLVAQEQRDEARNEEARSQQHCQDPWCHARENITQIGWPVLSARHKWA